MVFFCDWLISPSIVSSRLIHIVACHIPFYVYIILFIHAPLGGHLGCSPLLAIVNNTGMNVDVQMVMVSFEVQVFNFDDV